MVPSIAEVKLRMPIARANGGNRSRLREEPCDFGHGDEQSSTMATGMIARAVYSGQTPWVGAAEGNRR